MWSVGRLCAIVGLVSLLGSSEVTANALARDQTPFINQVCNQMQNGELLANPYNCNYYYYCQNGIGYIQQCTSGYYFDKDSQKCLPPNQVYCYASTNYACQGQADGTSVSVSGNCNAYYTCSGTDSLGQIGYCPANLNFNPTTRKCVDPTIYPCTNYDSGTGDSLSSFNFCDYVQNGVPFNDPSSCQKWFICQNNRISEGACTTNFSFNTLSGSCVYNTTCWQNLNNSDNGDNVSPIGGSCSQFAQTTAVPTSCNAFYKCNGQDYVLTYCPNDLYYDTVSGSCVSQLNARNNCNRCEGNSLEFVNQYSTTGCNGYIYCVNGAASSTGTCPSGYYFNQVAGACQTGGAQPAFGCCNPTVYNT